MAVPTETTTYDVYVANIPINYNEVQVREIFNIGGDIVDVKFLPAKMEILGKAAFVRFLNEVDAQCVAEYMSNYELDDGRNLIVNYRSPQSNGTSKPLVKAHTNGTGAGNSVSLTKAFGHKAGNNTSPVDFRSKSSISSRSPPGKVLSNNSNHSNIPVKAHVKKHGANNPRKAHVNTTVNSTAKVVNGDDKKIDESPVAIYVSNVSAPLLFSAHLFSKESASKLDHLTQEMELLCPSQPNVVGQLNMGMLYGCKFSLDEMWYRCRIQKVLPKNMVNVCYVDYGNSEVVNRSVLIRLPVEVGSLPPLCQDYVLDGLELIDLEPTSDLYMKVLDLFRSIISDKRVEVKIIRKEANRTRVKFLKVIDSPHSDNFHEKMLATGAVKMKITSKSSQQKTLIKFPTTMKMPIVKSPSSALKSSPTVMTPVSAKSPVTEPPPPPTKEQDIAATVFPGNNEILAPKSNVLQVYVSHIESPLEFWGQVFDEEVELKLLSLTTLLEDICPTQRKIKSGDPQDVIYGCQFSQDSLWYRCKIEEAINNTEVQVRYVDYGNSEIILRNGIVALPPDMVEIEAFAKHYKLGGLELMNVNTESTFQNCHEGIIALQELIADQKVQLHELKIEYGTHIVHIDKIANESQWVDIDVNAKLIAKGAVCARADRNTKDQKDKKERPKPEKVKRMIFTADNKDDHTEGEPVVVPNPKPFIGQLSGNENDTNEVASKVNSIKPSARPSMQMINGVVESDQIEEISDILDDTAEQRKLLESLEEKEKKISELEESLSNLNKLIEMNKKMEDQVSHQEDKITYLEKNMEKLGELTCINEQLKSDMEIKDRELLSLEKRLDKLDELACINEQLKIDIQSKDMELLSLKNTVLLENYQQQLSLIENRIGQSTVTGYEDGLDIEPDVPKVTCEEIGGYTKEISEIKFLVNLSLHNDLFNNMGIKPPRGVLLCGPHGTGKTFIARAIANESNVFYKEMFGPKLVGMSLEDSKRMLVKVFTEVAKNTPSILIIDQIDAIAKKQVGENKLLAQLITQLNYLRNNVTVICTASCASSLDPSLKYIGLFDKEVIIDKPDEINSLLLRKCPFVS